MSAELISELLDLQSGVIARHQFLTATEHRGDIQRRLRSREWVRLLPGVFVNHTGEPTWVQRAWAGVLACWPAALTHDSALRAYNGPGWRGHDDAQPIQLAVDRSRHLATPPGYVLRRRTGLDSVAQWNLTPPRVRFEEAVVDVAAAASEHGAIEALSEACRARRTTPERLLAAVEDRQRVRRRTFLESVLGDVAAGTCSVLEQAYLDRVERAHRLPRGTRQAPATSSLGGIYRDVDYDSFALVVELDGRLFHTTSQQRDRDLDRDLDAAVDGRPTVRLGWGQVVHRPCLTARRIATLLQQRGWAGSPERCGDGCTL